MRATQERTMTMNEHVAALASWWVVAGHAGGVDPRMLYPTKGECEKYINGRVGLYAAELVSATRVELWKAIVAAEAQAFEVERAANRLLRTALERIASGNTDSLAGDPGQWPSFIAAIALGWECDEPDGELHPPKQGAGL
jgi:hypothetical protein